MNMLQFRRFHLAALVIVLVIVTGVVFTRGVDARGLSLIGLIAVVVAFRWWQLVRAHRDG